MELRRSKIIERKEKTKYFLLRSSQFSPRLYYGENTAYRDQGKGWFSFGLSSLVELAIET